MSNVVELDRFRRRPARNEGTTFVACLRCRQYVELDLEVCPNCGGNPHVQAAVPVQAAPAPPPVEVVEVLDEHVYVSGDVFCESCGTHVSEALTKPCGKR